MGRLRLVIVSSALALVACNAVLGLRDIEEAAPTPDASSDGGGTTMLDGSEAIDASTDTLAAAEGAAPDGASGFCARYGSAIVCDDFESGNVSPRWQIVKQGTTPFVRIDPRSDAVDGGANQHVGTLGFHPIPDVGVSALAIDMPNGRRSCGWRSSFRSTDGPHQASVWRGWSTPPARGSSSSPNRRRVGSGSTWSAPTSPTATSVVTEMGFLIDHVWTCLEIELDVDETVRASQDGTPSVGGVSPSFATTPLQAQVGMFWDSFANPTESKYVSVDNVVVASGAVGCP